MIVLLTITAILLFIASIVIIPIGASILDFKWWHVILGLLIEWVILTAFACVLNTAVNLNKPTAIDVYRGKTTLKISYIDSIPQDTIVVFKQ